MTAISEAFKKAGVKIELSPQQMIILNHVSKRADLWTSLKELEAKAGVPYATVREEMEFVRKTFPGVLERRDGHLYRWYPGKGMEDCVFGAKPIIGDPLGASRNVPGEMRRAARAPGPVIDCTPESKPGDAIPEHLKSAKTGHPFLDLFLTEGVTAISKRLGIVPSTVIRWRAKAESGQLLVLDKRSLEAAQKIGLVEGKHYTMFEPDAARARSGRKHVKAAAAKQREEQKMKDKEPVQESRQAPLKREIKRATRSKLRISKDMVAGTYLLEKNGQTMTLTPDEWATLKSAR